MDADLELAAGHLAEGGPVGLGILRAAPAVGAIGMAVTLAYFPLQRSVGRTLYLSVAIFGLATILFALSENFALSLGMLAILGAADLVSVFVRSTAYPGRDFEGKVAEMAPSLALPRMGSRGVRRPTDVEVMEVVIHLDGAVPLLPGMRVDTFFRR